MSAIAPCGGCSMGDHGKHVEHWLDAGPGVLGGAVCNCSGDCKPPDLSWLIPNFPAPSGEAAEPTTTDGA